MRINHRAQGLLFLLLYSAQLHVESHEENILQAAWTSFFVVNRTCDKKSNSEKQPLKNPFNS
jgi:hypothetical protein